MNTQLSKMLRHAVSLTFALTVPAVLAAQGHTDQPASQEGSTPDKKVSAPTATSPSATTAPKAPAAAPKTVAATAPAPKATATAAPKTAAAPAAPAAAPAAPAADAPQSVPTVVVVASRIAEPLWEVPGTVDVISLDEQLTSGVTSLAESVRYIPGVSIPFAAGATSGATPYARGGEKGVNIRGLDGNRVAILTDGIPQPDDFTAGTAQGFANPGRLYFDPATFTQLEIYKSAASSLYGSGALSGAIGTRTVSPADLLGPTLKGVALADTATFASVNRSLHNLAQAAVGDGDWAASAVHSYRTGHERDTRGSEDLNPATFHSQAVVAKLDRRIGNNVKLEATADYYRRDERVLTTNAAGTMNMGPTRYEYLPSVQNNDSERLRLSLGAEITPTAGTNPLWDRLEMLAYWQDAHSGTFNEATTNIVRTTGTTQRVRTNTLYNDTETAGINAIARKEFTTGTIAHRLQYGIEASHGDALSTFDRLENGAPTASPTAMAPSEIWRAGAYVSDRIAFGPQGRYRLTPSVRTDYFNVNPDNTPEYIEFAGSKAASYVNWSVNPGLTASWHPRAGLNLYATYGMGTRNPSADELNGSFIHSGSGAMGGADQIRTYPNQHLKNETSHSFEIGTSGALGDHTFHAAAYYNIYYNFIESMYNTRTTDADGYNVYSSRNLDDVSIYGIELSYDWRPSRHLAGLQAGAAFNWTRGRQATPDLGHQPLDSVDPPKLTAYIGYVNPDDTWGIRLTATYITRKQNGEISRYLDGTTPTLSTAPIGDAFLLDLGGHYRFDKHWTLNAGINNLTNREYHLWSAARNSGMSSARYTQPGINGYISLTARF